MTSPHRDYTDAMSLGTRLTLKTAALVLAVVVVALVALWGLGGLNRDLDTALGEYDRLREVYILSNDAQQARAYLRKPPYQPEQAQQMLLRLVLRAQDLQAMVKPDRLVAVRESFRDILAQVNAPAKGTDPYHLASVQLYTPIGYLASEIHDTNERIKQIQRQAQANRLKVQWWVGGIALVTASLAIAVGVWQYLAVMNPLRRLQRGVKRLSSGDFDYSLNTKGDREFVALGEDFNAMAQELRTLYNELEEKVRIRSAQLAQSERLASVGFLAAGVAHEINNPLAIIVGEAELALGALPGDADAELRQALSTMRDEAFRCKAITQKLVSLARPGTGKREPVDLVALAEEVASLVRTLPQHDGRRVTVSADAQQTATTDAAQVKQVLLNLAINALEAVQPGGGTVSIRVDASAGRASLSVIDNGKGIDGEALKRVFQPFYTEKTSPSTPGLGLGLSISHAIIEDLGGRLFAKSDGLGKGSTFTIELPSTQESTTPA